MDEKSLDKRIISYSQLSQINNCLLQWYLRKIKRIKFPSQTIFTLYGTAIHETVQYYLSIVYSESKKKADSINLENYFLKVLNHLFDKITDEEKEPIDFNNLMNDFIAPTAEIIKDFKKKFFKYFGVRDYKLIGNEIELNESLIKHYNLEKFNENKDIIFNGKIDTALHDIKNDIYYLIDYKTSFKGWSSQQKKDENKRRQLLLYKIFFAEKYNIPLKKIKIMFIILKRKIFQPKNVEFKISRIQKVDLPSTRNIKKVDKYLIDSIKYLFNEDLSFNEKYLEKFKEDVANKKVKPDCKYCMYKNTKYCTIKKWKKLI